MDESYSATISGERFYFTNQEIDACAGHPERGISAGEQCEGCGRALDCDARLLVNPRRDQLHCSECGASYRLDRIDDG